MEFSRPAYWSGKPFPSPGDLPNSGIEPRSPALQADPLPAEPQGKPKNIGVGSLSLLQGIFPTQESNWGLLHCRRTLYQLSYKYWWRACGIRVLSVTTWQMMDPLLRVMIKNLRWGPVSMVHFFSRSVQWESCRAVCRVGYSPGWQFTWLSMTKEEL